MTQEIDLESTAGRTQVGHFPTDSLLNLYFKEWFIIIVYFYFYLKYNMNFMAQWKNNLSLLPT